MNKTELVEALASHAEITKAAAAKILEALLDTITNSLRKGNDVTIPGFGTFTISNRAARTGRNPQTGATIQIKAARVAKFKAGKKLKDAISG